MSDRLKMPAGATGAMALSPDGTTLAASITRPNQSKIVMWNVATRERRGVLRSREHAFGSQILAGVFSRDNTLAWAASGRDFWVWNISTQTHSVVHANPGDVCTVAFSPRNSVLAAGGDEGVVMLWDCAAHESAGFLKRPFNPAQSLSNKTKNIALGLAFSPDGRTIAVAYQGPTEIVVWDVKSQKPLKHLEENKNAIACLAYSADGGMLASCDWMGQIVLWNTRTWKLTILRGGHKGPVNALAFSHDGKTLATGGEDGRVKLWNLATRQEVAVLKGHAQPIRFLGFSADDSLLVSGDREQAILWHAATMASIAERERSGF